MKEIALHSQNWPEACDIVFFSFFLYANTLFVFITPPLPFFSSMWPICNYKYNKKKTKLSEGFSTRPLYIFLFLFLFGNIGKSGLSLIELLVDIGGYCWS